MDAVSRVRAASCRAVDEVEPTGLREIITGQIESDSSTFGLATIVVSEEVRHTDEESIIVDSKAAGVQLIYEGLRLTQDLVRENRWKNNEQKLITDMDLLAADVMVARGFYLLSHTKAAPKAVETIRAFGITEAEWSDTPIGTPTRRMNLERNIFELAIIAGFGSSSSEMPSEFDTRQLLNFDISKESKDHILRLIQTIEQGEEGDFLLVISSGK
tara:strand:- start:14482 stop:15126 length:645 start_codon:yes stop_codon:yes gene_type:complete